MILFNSLLKRHSNILHNYVPGKTCLCGFKDCRTESFNRCRHKMTARVCSFHFWWRNSMTPTVYCDMPSWNSFYWFEIKKFLLSTVMLLTTLCWWIYDGDSFKLFLTVLLCWWQCKESSASISKLVTNTYRLQQPSPTPVIINDIAVLTRWRSQSSIWAFHPSERISMSVKMKI